MESPHHLAFGQFKPTKNIVALMPPFGQKFTVVEVLSYNYYNYFPFLSPNSTNSEPPRN
jgi:hypothetical protein